MSSLMMAALAAVAMAGLVAITVGLVGTRPSLADASVALHRPRRDHGGHAQSWLTPLVGKASPGREADLAVCERDGVRWVQDRLKWAGFGAVMAAAGTVLVPTAAGIPVSLTLVTLALSGGLIGGWFYAIVDLRSDAEKARRDIRHAVATYLELVTILMAGGAGPESAMYAAAEVGRGSAFRHLRSALATAQVRQEPPWAALGDVGRRIGVAELLELGASLTLAGGGAQVKDSLAAKAGAIRVNDLAQRESEAQARSETMALPVVMMFTGFLLLLGYPALAGLAGP